jgi:hypothetical protein
VGAGAGHFRVFVIPGFARTSWAESEIEVTRKDSLQPLHDTLSEFVMKPIQVYLGEDDAARLEAWSRANGMTKSDALRLAVRALTRPRTVQDPVLSLSGILHDDLPPDVAERFNRYLQETFVAERPAAYKRGRPSRTRR